MDRNAPPTPLGLEDFGPPLTDERIRGIRDLLEPADAEQVIAGWDKQRQRRADEYNREQLRDWRETYGPDLDDDDDDD